MPTKKLYDGISGVGASSIDSTVLQGTNQGTFYGGLKVTESIKNQLMEQEIGNYLHAVQLEDGDYLLKHKLPETGMTEDKERYSIRKNWNRIMKGIGERLFDKDGNMDLLKASEIGQDVVDAAMNYDPIYEPEKSKNSKKFFQNLIGYKNLSKEEQKDFDTFFNVPGTVRNLYRMGGLLSLDMRKMYRYQKRLIEGDLSNEVYKKLIKDSAKDYVQLLNQYKNISKMDVKNEHELYIPSDCDSLSILHNTYYNDVMRDKNPEWNINQTKVVNLSFPDKDENNNEAHFTEHHAFAFQVNINGESKYMTLETTAPPAGKFLFHPEKGVGGLGIYENFEAFKELNEKSNYTIIIENPEVNQINCFPDTEKDAPPLKIELAFIEKSLEKLRKSQRLFVSNSSIYETMKASTQRITQLKEQLQDEPENAEQLKINLQEEYKTLKDVSKEYLDTRKGAKSIEGLRRLKIAEKLYQYAEEMLKPKEKASEQKVQNENTAEQELQSQSEAANQPETTDQVQEANASEAQNEDEFVM